MTGKFRLLRRIALCAGLCALSGAANAAEDIFHDFFYGIFPADPQTKPSGAPCTNGDLYYNSISRTLKMRA